MKIFNFLLALINGIVAIIESFLIRFGLIYKEVNVVFLGLDNAGKTTMINTLLYEGNQNLTLIFENKMVFGNTCYICHDLGGIQRRRV